MDAFIKIGKKTNRPIEDDTSASKKKRKSMSSSLSIASRLRPQKKSTTTQHAREYHLSLGDVQKKGRASAGTDDEVEEIEEGEVKDAINSAPDIPIESTSEQEDKEYNDQQTSRPESRSEEEFDLAEVNIYDVPNWSQYDNQTLEDILRVKWDLNPKFGPFTGMNRLRRWERAQRFGLGPPQCVKDILESGRVETSCLKSAYF